MTAAARASNKLWSIQYVRAAAVVAVVVYHQFQEYSWLFRQGARGVDLFFVISGFIMVAMTDGRDISPARFILDRIARIVPLYWIATGLLFFAAAIGVDFYRASADPILLLKSLVFIPAARADGEVLPTLPFGWTLNFEMFFYSLFAATLLARERLRAPLLCALFVGLVIAGLAFRPEGVVLATYTDPLILEFLAGALLGKLFGAGLHRFSVPPTLGLTALLIAALALTATRLPHLEVAWLAVLIVAGGLLVERAGSMPQVPLLKLIGDASFAIYLFQQVAFHGVEAVVSRLERLAPVLAGHAIVVHLINALAALVLGCLVYRFVERPVTGAVRRAIQRLTHVPARLSQGA